MNTEEYIQFRKLLKNLKSPIAKGDVEFGDGPVYLRGHNGCLEIIERYLDKLQFTLDGAPDA